MRIKNSKGVTLIALVITIVVLLILASITINASIEDKGLIAKVKEGKAFHEQEKQKEELELEKAEWELVEMGATHDTVDKIVSKVPIPKGFYYVGGTKETGLVISSIEGDDMENSKNGNQFVWVPVNNLDAFAKLQEGTNNYRGVLYASNVGADSVTYFGTENINFNPNDGLREPAIVTESNTDIGTTLDADIANINIIIDDGYKKTATGLLKQFQDEYNAMVKSVATYGGFYVGRYETNKSYGSTEDEEPINNVDWYNMYQGQKNYMLEVQV